MATNDAYTGREHLKEQQQIGKTIDLQGVASFAALVELLASELGTESGKMHGNLPSGSAFNQLVGEIELNNKGFQRKLILFAQPGSPLTLRFKTIWNEGSIPDAPQPAPEVDDENGLVADYFLNGTVEQILPQGRALARYIEDIFAVLDRMVSLGQNSRLSRVSLPASKIEAFEQAEAGNLVRSYAPKSHGLV